MDTHSLLDATAPNAQLKPCGPSKDTLGLASVTCNGGLALQDLRDRDLRHSSVMTALVGNGLGDRPGRLGTGNADHTRSHKHQHIHGICTWYKSQTNAEESRFQGIVDKGQRYICVWLMSDTCSLHYPTTYTTGTHRHTQL